jgi:hypothetical protein
MRGLHVGMVMAVVGLAAVTAAQSQEQYTVYGHGSTSCTRWTADRSEILVRARSAWVLGFVSGAAWEGASLKTTDAERITAWMDQYCMQHPIDDVSKAASELVRQLTKQ